MYYYGMVFDNIANFRYFAQSVDVEETLLIWGGN